jgi:phosphoribosylglycinamide formyltransferase-1
MASERGENGRADEKIQLRLFFARTRACQAQDASLASPSMKAKIAVCASGEGTNFEAIVEASRQGALAADIVGLIANRAGIGAIRRAEKLGIPHRVISAKNFPSRGEWDEAVAAQLREWQADWVVLAGFLALIGPKTLKTFHRRIVNTHPALLPKFGGAGMYGDFVHAAVLKAKEKESGVTIHLIDEVYDRGRILAQERVKVEPSDTLESLSARVRALEISLYPRVLNDLVTGRISSGEES